MADEAKPDTPPTAEGTATRWTAAEIDAMAKVTDADEAPAKESWHRHAPDQYRGLIDATEAEEG